MDYRVEVPEFHGPLDLLLHLVKRNEVDVLDIPIAPITEQFKAYLDVLQAIDFDQAGEFVVTLTHLMEIKSRLALPRPPNAAAEEADPRRELVQQLLEYKKFKDAAARLESRAAAQQRRLPRQRVAEPAGPAGPPAVRPVELWDLVSAFGRLMSEAEALAPVPVIADDTPQAVYEGLIRERLAGGARVEFRELFMPPYHRARLVGLFLGLLELIRRGELLLEQPETFGAIWITAAHPPRQCPSETVAGG